MHKQYLLFVVILFSGQLCSATTKNGYEFIPDVNGWLRLDIVPSTWANARLACQLEGGTLASPKSVGVAAAMKRMMSEEGHTLDMAYTGINANVANEDYKTIDGLPLSNISLNWGATVEPNSEQNRKDCLVMNRAGEVADVDCSRLFGYFCFKENCGTWDSAYQLDARTGSCYKFHTVPQKWHRAALTCRAEGAHLAVINSDIEAQVLKDLFVKYRPATIQHFNQYFGFIGFWDWTKRRDWRTIFGQTLAEAGYETWGNLQPDNYENNENCGAIHYKGQLHDFSCNSTLYFICEIMNQS